MEKLKKTKILGIVGSIMIFISLFLPGLKMSFSMLGITSSSTIKVFEYWEGKIILFLIVLILILMFKEIVMKYVPQIFDNKIVKTVESKCKKSILLPAGMIALLAIIMLIRTKSIVGDTYDYVGIKYGMGIGYWLLWLGIGAIIVYAFLYEGDSNTIKPQMNQHEQPVDNISNNKYCSKCGNQCDSNTVYCSKCGNKI